MAAINLSSKLTDSNRVSKMEALLSAILSDTQTYVSKNDNCRAEVRLEVMCRAFRLDGMTAAPYVKRMVSLAADHINLCYGYHFINYAILDWEYKPNRKCFVVRYHHEDAEKWFGTDGPYHLPFDRFRFPIVDRDFMTILVALVYNLHENEIPEWIHLDDNYETVRFVATEGYVKQLRERLNWSGFKKSLERWRNETVSLCTEGSFSGIWSTNVIEKVELTDDKEILWITMTKRMVLSIIEYMKSWEQN